MSHHHASKLNKAVSFLLFPNKSALTYTSCYCEENIWKLCEMLHASFNPVQQQQHNRGNNVNTFAVFISSPTERVPFWYQQSRPRGMVVWDYHVIMVHKMKHAMEQRQQNTEDDDTHSSLVYDMDTVLGFPCDFGEYISNSLLTTLSIRDMIKGSEEEAELIAREYLDMLDQVRFRVVSSQQFYNNFSSDRSHMINKETNEWMMPPPSYSCIKRHATEIMNLPKYRDMSSVDNTLTDSEIQDAPFGKVVNLEQLCSFFGEDYQDLIKSAKNK